MLDQVNATPTPHKRLPWKKGKLTGAKPPLRPKQVWSIWTTLQIEGRARDLTMFNLVIDSKLRGSNLAHERPLCANSGRSTTRRARAEADDTARSATPCSSKRVCGWGLRLLSITGSQLRIDR
jgi:hypothetical protein